MLSLIVEFYQILGFKFSKSFCLKVQDLKTEGIGGSKVYVSTSEPTGSNKYSHKLKYKENIMKILLFFYFFTKYFLQDDERVHQ